MDLSQICMLIKTIVAIETIFISSMTSFVGNIFSTEPTA